MAEEDTVTEPEEGEELLEGEEGEAPAEGDADGDSADATPEEKSD